MVSVRLFISSVDKDGDVVHPVEVGVLLTLLLNRTKLVSIMTGELFIRDKNGEPHQGRSLEVLILVEEDELEALVERIHEEMSGPMFQEFVYMEVDGKPSIR